MRARDCCEFEIARGAGRHLILCPRGKVNPGCQRIVTIFSGDVAQLVRATGLYSVLASDKRKVVGSSPTVPTVFGASSNGRTRVFGALNLGSNPSAPSIYSAVTQWQSVWLLTTWL